MNGSQAVIKCLKEHRVNTVFGYPGGMILPLFDALYEDDEINFVLTTHEQSAAHAADGYARASGTAGVCMATSGPGATNLVTGIATAFMDSVPVVIITGQVDSTLLGKDSFQETDIFGITMPITKHNFKLQSADKLIPVLHEAFSLALSGRQGPVLVDIPKNFFAADVNYIKQAEAPSKKSQPDADFLICAAEAIDEILKAKRPVIISGGGVISAEADKELIAFAEKYKIPVVSTLMGIGAFPNDHPLYMGFGGLHGRKSANYAVSGADLVIAVGSRFADRQTGDVAHYVEEKHFIHIDIDPAEIDKNVHSSIGLSGDMKIILKLLMQRDATNDLTDWWKILHEQRDEFAYDYTGKYDVPNIMHHISESISTDKHVVVTDVGQHQMWAAQHIRRCGPRTWFTSGGLGTMGFGLPAAVGIQMYYKNEKRVIHIAGDGGIKMTGSEYYTIAAHNLPIISIIINNDSLGMIMQLQKVFYGGRYFACNFKHKMDYAKYAESFGINTYDVHSMDEFIDAFAKALHSKTPQAIIVSIGKDFVRPMVNTLKGINSFIDFKKV